MAFTYQADVWCEECGKAIKCELAAQRQPPEDEDDEHTYDSGDWPKKYDPDNERADSPQNCAAGAECLDTTRVDITRGKFLENGLTEHGYKYLKGMLDEHGEVLPPYAQEWADYYSFEFHKQQWSNAHEWLESHLRALAEKPAYCEACGKLWDVAMSLAKELDGDKIQDLFQSDMDDDGYFKEEGWYSSEMD